MRACCCWAAHPWMVPRYIWWNFVSSRKEAIMQAAEDWENRKMPLIPGDESEFIPLSGARPKLRDRE